MSTESETITAAADIIKLWQDLNTKINAAKQAEIALKQAEIALNEFIRAVRLTLGIPVSEQWEIVGDASALRKSPTPTAPPAPPVEPPTPPTPDAV